jgi:hypothetical protein
MKMKIRFLFFSALALIPQMLTAQYDDYNDEDDYEDDYPAVSKYEVVRSKENGLESLVQKEGKKTVIPCIYKTIVVEGTYEGEIENYFKVVNNNDQTGIYSLKDRKEIVPCKYADIEIFYNDFYPDNDENPALLCAFIAGNSTDPNIPKDYYSINGSLIISTNNDVEWDINPSEDIIIGLLYNHDDYSVKNGYFAIQRLTGKIIRNKKCNIVENGSTNQFIVKENSKVGVIDAITGNAIIPVEYDSITGDFFNTRFISYKNGKIEVLSDKGKAILPLGKYNDFSLGNLSDTMWVSKNKKWGAVDYTEKEIVPFQYDTVIFRDYYGDKYFEYYTVKKNNKWGCVKINGETVLPVEFDKPIEYSDSMFVVKDGKWHWIDKDNNDLINFNFKSDASWISKMEYNRLGQRIELDKGIQFSLLRNRIEIPSLLENELLSKGEMNLLRFCLDYLTPEDKGGLLYRAIDEKKYDIFYMVLKSNPDLNYKFSAYDDNLFTAIIRNLRENKMSKEEFISVLSAYLQAGANPNVLDWNGESPLITYLWSFSPQDTEVIDIFIKGGAKVKFKDRNNKTALDYAKNVPSNVKNALKEYAKLE